MKSLFIDTHLFDIHIYLFENNEIIKEKHIVGEKHNSKFLIPSIQEVCDGHSYDQIIVVNGPGSFTGVRLGVTVAKTLAYTQNIPIKVVSSLECFDFSGDGNAHIYGISDGNGYFIGEFVNHALTRNYYYLSNSEYQEYAKSHTIETNVTIDYKKVLSQLETIPASNPHSVNPIYIKLIGVEHDKRN